MHMASSPKACNSLRSVQPNLDPNHRGTDWSVTTGPKGPVTDSRLEFSMQYPRPAGVV